MEKELEARLDKLTLGQITTHLPPLSQINITILTLEALRAHINENHPGRFGDVGMLEDVIEVVKDYR